MYNILKFKSSAFQFSFNIGTNSPDNPIYNNYDRNISVNHSLPPHAYYAHVFVRELWLIMLVINVDNELRIRNIYIRVIRDLWNRSCNSCRSFHIIFKTPPLYRIKSIGILRKFMFYIKQNIKIANFSFSLFYTLILQLIHSHALWHHHNISRENYSIIQQYNAFPHVRGFARSISFNRKIEERNMHIDMHIDRYRFTFAYIRIFYKYKA